MGNLAVRTVNQLRNPELVRRFQHLCGARVEEAKDDGKQNEDICRPTYRARIDSSPDITPPASPAGSSNRVQVFPLPGTVVRTNTFVDIYFRMATEVGYEMFYILVLPIIHFNFDAVILRQMIILWSLSMYVGQALKSVICIKRPAAPPVLKLENNPILDQEYGFPSTHAIVSTVMPVYFMVSLNTRYQFPLWLGLLFCAVWSLSVSCSRIYLGVHSVLDIIGGYLISLAALLLSLRYMDALDLLLHSPYAPALACCTVVALLAVYPVDSKRWTMDRGDTAAILGVGLGVVLGVNCMGEVQDDVLPLPIPLHWPSLSQVWLATLRYVCGVFLLIPTRFVMKLLCFRLLPAIMPTGGVQEVSKRPWVELPYKVITYSAIGFNCYYTSIFFFRVLGINRF